MNDYKLAIKFMYNQQNDTKIYCYKQQRCRYGHCAVLWLTLRNYFAKFYDTKYVALPTKYRFIVLL